MQLISFCDIYYLGKADQSQIKCHEVNKVIFLVLCYIKETLLLLDCITIIILYGPNEIKMLHQLKTSA